MTALPLERQVCSEQYAIRLRNLGVKQESVFHWRNKGDGPELSRSRYGGRTILGRIASAFTITELGKMLEHATHADIEKAYCKVMALRPEDIGVLGPFQIVLAMIEQPDISGKVLTPTYWRINCDGMKWRRYRFETKAE